MSASTFAREFIRNWKTVGAIMPSSAALAHRMVEAANVPHARRVLELGPGTGAFTGAIKDCLPPTGKYLGIEMNATFVDTLTKQFPGFEFATAAAQEYDFNTYLPPGESFDAIVSGLPWTAFPEGLQREILDHVMCRLVPGGCFATFAYFGFHKLPGGRHFRELLKQQPGRLRMTTVVWGNVPPAFVYVVQRDQ